MKKIKFISLNILLFCSIIISKLQAQTSLFANIDIDGVSREYKIYIPAIYDGSVAVPLVFNFHGYGSSFTEQEQYGDFRAIADTANFILIHPQGLPDNFGTSSWNTFGNSTANDLGFISTLIDTLLQNYNIDSTAIYSTGMSNGGFMSYELACQLSHRIAAIASVTGSITNTNITLCNAQHPMPVMQIHGTNDGTVPYAGNVIFQPIENVINYWIQFNNCDTAANFNAIPDIVSTDNCTAEHYVYSNGNNGVEVEFYKIINGGHSWPGAPVNINTTNMDFMANQEIWRFFRKYKLGGSILTSDNYKIAAQHDFNVFPNPSSSDFTIQFQNEKYRKIKLSNALGQLISAFYCNTNRVVLTPPHTGIYFITIEETDGSIQSKRLIKL
ncbi:MAG TPA: T9SS type A sorting domain-containing protein [Bacteroidia bacterium]|nr:T9SS type A sorting domain-containing protein [Bacteroidia bacterium]